MILKGISQILPFVSKLQLNLRGLDIFIHENYIYEIELLKRFFLDRVFNEVFFSDRRLLYFKMRAFIFDILYISPILILN